MKRKIAMISDHASPIAALGGVDSGGQNVYVNQLSRHLASLGYEIDIFTRWEDGRLPQVIDWINNIRIVHIKAGPDKYIKKEDILPYMREFAENMISYSRLQGHPYQLMHANFFMSGMVASMVKERLNLPFVITFHALGKVRQIYQGKADKFPQERPVIEEAIMKVADQIIAECPQDREDMINYYGADPAKISLVPCGFDPHEFYPIDKMLAKMTLGLDPDKRYLLQLGRMVPRKGVENVIRALAIANRKYDSGLHLLVVGGESTEPDAESNHEIKRLTKIAEAVGAVNDITFVGRKDRETLKFYYSAADIFASTPWYEPFGITPLEAMACGTPVLGSRVGGIKYSVLDNETGFLIEPKNPMQLAEKLAELAGNPEKLIQFQEKALKHVTANFTWAKVANQISVVYERLLYGQGYSTQDYASQLTLVENAYQDLSDTLQKAKEALRIPLLDAAHSISHALLNNRKALVCGNGGSAAQAQHLAGELVGRFKLEKRAGLPVLSLTADPTILTAWANDYSYDDVFARQVEAYGQRGDVLIGLSTSGNSKNVIKAFKEARKNNIRTITLLGKDGGKLKDHADTVLIVPSFDTTHIQEIHLLLIHLLCDLVERRVASQADRIALELKRPRKQSNQLGLTLNLEKYPIKE